MHRCPPAPPVGRWLRCEACTGLLFERGGHPAILLRWSVRLRLLVGCRRRSALTTSRGCCRRPGPMARPWRSGTRRFWNCSTAPALGFLRWSGCRLMILIGSLDWSACKERVGSSGWYPWAPMRLAQWRRTWCGPVPSWPAPVEVRPRCSSMPVVGRCRGKAPGRSCGPQRPGPA